MTTTNKKQNWYLDATVMDQKDYIKTIKAIREYSNLGLKEAKDLVDRARAGSVLLPDSFVVTTKSVVALKAVNVTVRTEKGPVTNKETQESVLLETKQEINRLLSNCSPGPLMALARFYGIKGRGRMATAQLIHALIPKMSRTEVVFPGRAQLIIDEARFIANAY